MRATTMVGQEVTSETSGSGNFRKFPGNFRDQMSASRKLDINKRNVIKRSLAPAGDALRRGDINGAPFRLLVRVRVTRTAAAAGRDRPRDVDSTGAAPTSRKWHAY